MKVLRNNPSSPSFYEKKLSSPSFVFDDRQTVAFNNFEDIGGRRDIYEFIHRQSEEIVLLTSRLRILSISLKQNWTVNQDCTIYSQIITHHLELLE